MDVMLSDLTKGKYVAPRKIEYIMAGDGAHGAETVQVTPLRRTIASSPLSECASCLQCFDTVGWAAGRASGL